MKTPIIDSHDTHTMLAELIERAQTLRLALIDGDKVTAERLQAWLMGEVAAGLIEQGTDTLLDLRAAVADLAPVADRYGDGKTGDRWRAVWELLYAVSQTSRPQEQQRLAQADRLSGQLLRLIGASPGIAPAEMAKRLDKGRNHISNTLRALLDQGLIYRVPHGRSAAYYATTEATAGLAAQAPRGPLPLATGAAAANDGGCRHIDPQRLPEPALRGRRPTFSLPAGAGR